MFKSKQKHNQGSNIVGKTNSTNREELKKKTHTSLPSQNVEIWHLESPTCGTSDSFYCFIKAVTPPTHAEHSRNSPKGLVNSTLQQLLGWHTVCQCWAVRKPPVVAMCRQKEHYLCNSRAYEFQKWFFWAIRWKNKRVLGLRLKSGRKKANLFCKKLVYRKAINKILNM